MSQTIPPITEAWVDAHIRPQFSRTSLRQEIYLANHSLGRPLDVMQTDVAEALNADELILLKARPTPAADDDFATLAASGYVDEYFPTIAPRLKCVRFVRLENSARKD